MRATTSIRIVLVAAALALTSVGTSTAPPNGAASILVYHRFGPAVADSMTVRTTTFIAQLEYLKAHQYTVVPLRALVNHFVKGTPLPPGRSVVITVDDGHKSVFTEMLPLVKKYRIPVTLFIYPSAISNASYAMTWDQLHALKETGLFDIQSHTYWHPNFKTEKKRLAPAAFHEFTTKQLCKSKEVLRAKLGVDTDLLAWPFGIHDEELAQLAKGCGYVAAFTLGGHVVEQTDQPMALPRFLMTDAASGARFAAMLPQ